MSILEALVVSIVWTFMLYALAVLISNRLWKRKKELESKNDNPK